MSDNMETIMQHQEFDSADVAALDQALPRILREDANIAWGPGNNSVFFARQLDYIKSRVYNRQLPAINADRLVPDSTETPEWAETVTVLTFDQVGMAKIVANYADDLPRADVRGTSSYVQVKTIGDSYGYNVIELRASRATGVGLDSRKADAARRAVDLKIASIKLQGDAQYGLYGLFTHPNVPTYTFPNPASWATLTGDQIYANLVGMAAAYTQQNLGVHVANFLELSPAAYNAAASKMVTAGGAPYPVTALQLFSGQHPGLTIENIWECTGAQAGHDVALMYERNIDNISHEMVMPFTQLPPEARNLEIVTDCLARSGGVHIYYPLALLSGLTS